MLGLKLRKRTLVLLGLGVFAGTISAIGVVSAQGATSGVDPSASPAAKDASLRTVSAPVAPVTSQPPSAPVTPIVSPPLRAAQIGTPLSLGGVPVPISPAIFTVSNMWQDVVGQTYVSIYAGAYVDDPTQGAIIVRVVSAVTGLTVPPTGEFRSPRRGGALSLTRVDASTMTLSFNYGDGTAAGLSIGTGAFK